MVFPSNPFICLSFSITLLSAPLNLWAKSVSVTLMGDRYCQDKKTLNRELTLPWKGVHTFIEIPKGQEERAAEYVRRVDASFAQLKTKPNLVIWCFSDFTPYPQSMPDANKSASIKAFQEALTSLMESFAVNRGHLLLVIPPLYPMLTTLSHHLKDPANQSLVQLLQSNQLTELHASAKEVLKQNPTSSAAYYFLAQSADSQQREYLKLAHVFDPLAPAKLLPWSDIAADYVSSLGAAVLDLEYAPTDLKRFTHQLLFELQSAIFF